MLHNRRGQVGETMTWVVATLIIVVILSMSILATTILSNSNKKFIFLNDKKKDFIATVSITNFLMNPENVKLLENKNHLVFEGKMKNFLKILPGSTIGGQGGWNFERDSAKETNQVLTYSLIPNVFGQYNYFGTEIFSKKMNLKFWEECQGKCK